MALEQDWRLEMYDGHLNGSSFQLKKFVSTATNDHEHCEFCFQKITDLDIADSEKEGYCTLNTKTGQTNWVCKLCFRDFKDRFHFKIST